MNIDEVEMNMDKEDWFWENGSGKLFDKVYYKRNGKTFARKAPGSYNKVPTEKQAAMRERFISAHRFAQSIIADSVLKAQYQARTKRGLNAYSTAVSEFLSALRYKDIGS